MGIEARRATPRDGANYIRPEERKGFSVYDSKLTNEDTPRGHESSPCGNQYAGERRRP